ncbi:MAG: hypothetical protein Q8K65_08245 [Alphaproteobacteria bacterium]|nr:hypothetical protein [Alphaproteobacteria bacterium]
MVTNLAPWICALVSRFLKMNIWQMCALSLTILGVHAFFPLSVFYRGGSSYPLVYYSAMFFVCLWFTAAFQKGEAITKRRRLLFCSCAIGIVFFLHYNMPVFKQLLAHYTFQETPLSYKKTGDLTCAAVSVVSASGIFDQNKFKLKGGTIGSFYYKYTIDGKTYESSSRSYLRHVFGCGETFSKAYYSPLNPAWTVVDNSLPEKYYWQNFFLSLGYLTFLLIFCAAIYWRSCRFRPMGKDEQIQK